MTQVIHKKIMIIPYEMSISVGLALTRILCGYGKRQHRIITVCFSEGSEEIIHPVWSTEPKLPRTRLAAFVEKKKITTFHVWRGP